jgi:hypothetical protein
MRIATFALFLLLICGGLTAQAPGAPGDSCGPTGKRYMRTTLYFGTKRKTGSVSEGQWRQFLKNEVTSRFPEGLTVWEATGQWRNPDGTIVREKSKVLLLVHDESPSLPSTVSAIIDSYKKQFDQQSVLWETVRVCASF